MLLRLRIVFALLFAVLFYLVALATAAGLLWAGVQVGTSLVHFRGRVIIVIGIAALGLIAAGAVVLWSLLPRWQRFVAPGPELSPQTHPKLFREVERIAALTGEAAPRHIYLVPDVNAFVTERGGVMGLFSQRVMGVGLPLLSNLTVAQLRSVLAHEFGHYAGGDVKLLPWINKARAAMIGSVQNLSSAAESANTSGSPSPRSSSPPCARRSCGPRSCTCASPRRSAARRRSPPTRSPAASRAPRRTSRP
jgi:heat shock protein HtpX